MAFLLGLVVLHYFFLWVSQRWHRSNNIDHDIEHDHDHVVEEHAYTEAPEESPPDIAAEDTRSHDVVTIASTTLQARSVSRLVFAVG